MVLTELKETARASRNEARKAAKEIGDFIKGMDNWSFVRGITNTKAKK